MKRIMHNLLITLLLTASPLGFAEGKTNLPNAFALRPPAEVPPPQTPPPQTPDTTPPITEPSSKPPTSPEPPTETPSTPFVMPTAPAPYVHPAPPKTPVPAKETPKVNTPPPTQLPQAIQPPTVQYIDLTSPENTGGIPRMDMPPVKRPGTDVPTITLTVPENGRSYAGWHNPTEPPVNHLQALFSKNNTTTIEQTAAKENTPRRKTKVRSEPAPLILPKNYIGEIPPVFMTSQNAVQTANASAFRRAPSAHDYDTSALFNFNQNSAAVDPEKRVIIETPNARRAALKVTENIAKFGAELFTPYGAWTDFKNAETITGKGFAVLGVFPAFKGAKFFNEFDKLKETKKAFRFDRDKSDVLSNARKNLTPSEIVQLQSPYSSRLWRNYLEEIWGSKNVLSTTIPPLSAKNVGLAGQKHLKTKVVFDHRGFPIFDKFAVYDTRVLSLADYKKQMRLATQDLAKAIDKGIVKKSQFNTEQLKAIERGDEKIPGFTWHHHQDSGRMQLVEETIHQQTGHIGNRAIRDGR